MSGTVLHQRPAERDVHQLESPADREDRNGARPSLCEQREFGPVTLDERRLRSVGDRAVPFRRDVLAAGEAEAAKVLRKRVTRLDGDDGEALVGQSA